MKRFFIIGFFIIFNICQLNALGIIEPTGGRSMSLGKCSVSLNDYWSLHNNPAGFASYKNLSLGISYHNRFLLKELSIKDIGLILPFQKGNIGMSYSQFGFTNYNENIFGLGIARNFGPNISIGIKLYYLSIKFSGDYEKISTSTFDIGIQYKINESLCLGAYIFNPINIRIKSLNKDKIPVIMRLGFSYFITKDFMLTGEVEENSDDNLSFRLGLEYEIYKNLFIRGGFQLKSEMLTFGIGYNHELFIIDVFAQMNQDLGATLGCSLIFKTKKIII